MVLVDIDLNLWYRDTSRFHSEKTSDLLASELDDPAVLSQCNLYFKMLYGYLTET